ncbi:replication initiation negative regulator SeqA [Gallibacterium trehalosifermentans]|uniref:Negative modulator of initiation of replication n=1 Tax=Gallibacterium trehalosifermentans TaxID=516935 RepID=A0ABV6H0P3_9PAST
MKTINIDDELYQYIASNTQSIGEDASTILRRLLNFPQINVSNDTTFTHSKATESEKSVSVDSHQEAKPQIEASIALQPKKPNEDTIAHISRQLQKLISSAEFIEEDKQVNRFLSILSVLYRASPEGFSSATEVSQGRSRVYFSLEVAEIEASGSSVNPKQIPKSPFWVATNNNTGRKWNMLESVMRAMYVPDSLIELVAQQFTSSHSTEENH